MKKHLTITTLLAVSLLPAVAAGGSAEPLQPAKPFTGKINHALTMARPSYVYIVPTHESDQAAQQAIQDYVHHVRDRLAPGAPIITDEEAINRKLSTNTIIVYGTLAGNRWLDGNLATHPVKIQPDKVIAGMVFPGEHLRFITTGRNPRNSNYAFVVYTAQRAEDIAGINSVFHGPTDFVVADGTNILQAADYEKRDGSWKFPDNSTHLATPPEATKPAADRLKQLKSTKEQGLIRPEDYDKKVKEIMDTL